MARHSWGSPVYQKSEIGNKAKKQDSGFKWDQWPGLNKNKIGIE